MRLPIMVTLVAAVLAPPVSRADDKIFDITELTANGRVVTAQFADFNGDGSRQLMLVSLQGIPPSEKRLIYIYDYSEATGLSASPNRIAEVPPWSAVYDIADIAATPGDELILLRPDRVTVLSLAERDAAQLDWPVEGPTTLAAAEDERGFERFKLAYDDFDASPWLLVPQMGAISVLSADGELKAHLEVGRRANYYVASGGDLLSVESDIQLYFDAPKISVGDINGDGLADVLTATRHELRVFLRDADGGLPPKASYTRPLELIAEADHSRGTGSVVTSARDIDADGRLDLMISHIEGTMVNTATKTRIFFNRDGDWNLDRPDDQFSADGAVTSNLLMNIDEDDALELVRLQIKFSVLEMVELLLTREIDTQIMIHQVQADGRFGDKPWSRKKIGTGINFDTFRPKGFMPRAGVDFNGDGLMDFVSSANGKGIEIFLGADEGPFAKRTAIQRMPTTGIMHVDDLNGDELADFVLFDPQAINPVVRIGVNLGVLPDSPR